jgi:hypothetical protein
MLSIAATPGQATNPPVASEPMDEPITLAREQARWLGLYVAGIDGAASVDLRRAASSDVAVAVYDKTGERIAGETLRSESDLSLR